jgi:hypothetical protein
MEGSFDREVLSHVPLAEAVLVLFRWITRTESLEKTFEAGRGRCYTRIFGIPMLVDLIRRCLLDGDKSARGSLVKAQDEGLLPVSIKAFYDKLAHLPLDVTVGFFRDGAAHLRQLMPQSVNILPPSLRGFSTQLVDGKVLKHVPRRLLQLRHNQVTACKLLGGRALVAVDLATGLVQDLIVDPDGEANDIKFVPRLLDSLQTSVQSPLLIVADRAFGVFQICLNILAHAGQFVLRLHGQTKFVADPAQAAVASFDRFGRKVIEEWGWILRGKETSKHCERIPVRRITVHRGQEALRLITSLLDAADYPAGDLLDVYLERWTIEQAFQRITEVFRLNALFSTRPQGILFQFAFCLLIYNVIHTVKQYVAQHQKRNEKTISTEMLFRDVHEELIAINRMLPVKNILTVVPEFSTAESIRAHMDKLLGSCWYNRWIKANHRPRNPAKPPSPKPKKIKQTKSHDSVHRILQRAAK